MSHINKALLKQKIEAIHEEVRSNNNRKRKERKEYLRAYLAGELKNRREWISSITANWTRDS